MDTTDNTIRIAYVDDDHDECFLFAEALKRLGIRHKLYTANKCSELIRLLETTTDFDIIFLDMNMPVTDGKECLKAVKEKAEWNHIPVVILTGAYNESDVTLVHEMGAHLYIIKPYIHTDFVKMLDSILSLD